MKKLLTALLLTASLSCFAQTNTTTAPAPAPTPQSFISTAESYFTSFDTNSTTFGTNGNYEMWTGASYQSGVNLGADFGLEARPFKGAPGLTLGSVTTLSSTVGTIAQQEIDLGWSIRHYDVELTLGAGGVDTFAGGSASPGLKGAVFAEVKKALTANTFAGVRIEGVFGGGSKANQPMIGIFAGFTF